MECDEDSYVPWKEPAAARGTQPHQITINAEGPFGPVPEFTSELDLSEYRGQDPQPQGNLHLRTKAVEKLAEKR
jgi:hypothetical protein